MPRLAPTPPRAYPANRPAPNPLANEVAELKHHVFWLRIWVGIGMVIALIWVAVFALEAIAKASGR